MEIEHAIKSLSESICRSNNYQGEHVTIVDYERFDEALTLAIEYLEKQIPKPVNFDIHDGEEPAERCPVCLSFAAGQYCMICGQKLDWSVE